MVSAVVIDQERQLSDLKHLLFDYCPEITLCKEFTSIENAMQELPFLHFDLLFLGLPLDNNAAKSLTYLKATRQFHIIAIDSANIAAIDHFQSSVSDVLSMPLAGKRLRISINNVLQQITYQPTVSQFDNYDTFCKTNNLVVNSKNYYYFIPIPLIKYCKASSSYTEILYKREDDYKENALNGTEQSTLTAIDSQTLSYFEKLLLPKGFVRIHNAYLVNKRYIRGIDRRKNNVILNDNTILPISRNRMDELLKEMI